MIDGNERTLLERTDPADTMAMRHFVDGIQALRLVGRDTLDIMDLFSRVLVTVEDLAAVDERALTIQHPDFTVVRALLEPAGVV